jgi:hypothetical protein
VNFTGLVSVSQRIILFMHFTILDAGVGLKKCTLLFINIPLIRSGICHGLPDRRLCSHISYILRIFTTVTDRCHNKSVVPLQFINLL